MFSIACFCWLLTDGLKTKREGSRENGADDDSDDERAAAPVLLRFLLCALILVAIVPRAFPYALATTTDTDGVVEFGGNATLGGDIAELGDAMWEWNKDNFGSNCNALASKWTTSMSSSQSKCNKCGGRVLLGGYNRFCKNDYAYRTYTDLPAHQRVKVTFKVYSIDTWDNEKFRLEAYWDNSWRVNKYFDQISKNSGGREHRCGQGCNNAKCRDGIHTYSHEFDHTSSNLKLKIWTNLNDGDCTDESWGLEYVSISFNHMPPPPSPPPPSPPPPSPSPPPPSPPPPGRKDEPTVEILNAQKVVSNREFDFGISVSHQACANSKSCFESEDDITSNQQKVSDAMFECKPKNKPRVQNTANTYRACNGTAFTIQRKLLKPEKLSRRPRRKAVKSSLAISKFGIGAIFE